MTSISLNPDTFSSISSFRIYHLDLLPAVISFQGGSSGAGSPDTSEYDFLFVRASEILDEGLLHDEVDRAPVL